MEIEQAAERAFDRAKGAMRRGLFISMFHGLMCFG
jgi:hypothetical protein